jgi:hypothetical protein
MTASEQEVGQSPQRPIWRGRCTRGHTAVLEQKSALPPAFLSLCEECRSTVRWERTALHAQ